MIYFRPANNAILHCTGYNELVKELGITEEEAKILMNKIEFDFWFTGNDYDTAKKWTIDGDDVYSELSFKEFLLAMICDYVAGAHRTGKPECA